jgi:molybdenum cofactor synthesis domain-containing protein
VSSEPRVVRTARAVTVGAEILSGKVHDTNSFELARTLRRLGIELTAIATVPDDLSAIEKAVRDARANADVVFTSGGIGPTHDDKTIEGVARAVGRPLVPVQASELVPGRLIPEGAALIRLGQSNWPTIVVDDIWLLPGIPELFRSKLSWLSDWLVGPTPLLTRAIYLDADETELVQALDEVVARHPSVEVGSYPAWSNAAFRTQITFDARDESNLLRAYEDFEARVRGRVVRGPGTDPV